MKDVILHCGSNNPLSSYSRNTNLVLENINVME